MRILWDNKYLSASITASSQDPDYPLSNTQDTRLTRLFRTNNLVDDQYITINTEIKASYVAIMNHNISSDATIQLLGANEDTNDVVDWDNPDVTISVTHRDYIIVQKFTEATYTDWRLTIDDPNNSDGYIKIGSVFIGTYLQMPGMSRKANNIDNLSTSEVSFSDSGQVYGDEGYDYRENSVSFPLISQDKREQIVSMYKEVTKIKPVIMLLWAERLDLEKPIYCVLTLDPKFKRTDSHNDPFQLQLKFREVF
ncbi:MAG: hypothetical protein JSW06_02785 [Thermoplasmatales archaeon]|nr:MAG: hypothetical protein JSW06_02785 [Thermoplasmatales archaeon]